jgi:heme a synthase
VRALRWASGVALVLTFGLIVLGAWVRATNSGLSCPDWPTCYGHWVPLPGDIPADAGYSYLQVMLEWVHRLIAGVVLGPLILVIGVLCCRARRTDPRMPAYAAILILLLLVQAGLGGVTVLDQNSPWSVALHLGTALVLLSLVCLIFERSGQNPQAGTAAVRTLSAIAWLVTLGAMVSAAMVAKTGAALACGASWPLCDGALLPDLGDPQIRLHFTHRLLALGAGLGVLALTLVARRPEIRPLAWLATALVAVEIGLGAAVVLGEVQFSTALAHQALGVLVFAILSLIMWRAHGRAAERETAHGLSHA